jgi:hypothetical protein
LVAPSFKAISYALNRILGKPTERVEHAGAVEMPPWEMSTDQLIDRARAILEAHGCQVVPQANWQCVECAPAGGEAQANGRGVE